jgi:hypothetical protein
MDALSRHANINPIITSTGIIFNYSLILFIFWVQFNYSLQQKAIHKYESLENMHMCDITYTPWCDKFKIRINDDKKICIEDI